jgi:SAM-dependent methyltransferase
MLLNSAQQEYICHGDLHLENIIQKNKHWLAIDPKGIIGEMAFEAAAFNLLSKEEMQETATIPQKIMDRTLKLSNALGINFERLLSWIFLRVLISAQWFIEDRGDPGEMLLLVAYLYPLLNCSRYKKNVYEVYEKISDWYDVHRSRDLFEKSYLDKVIALIPPNAAILDLGCGTGEPMIRYFLKQGYKVIGVDASIKQINKAKLRFPNVDFKCEDMRSLHLKEKFDCIIAWHSFFHLSQEDQRKMFATFENHIKPNGILVFTSGPEEGEVWSDNGGEMLYHASLSPTEYKSLLSNHHFDVLCHQSNDPNCGDATVWLAKYHLNSESL